ncbi:MAG: hypothetical protein ACREQ3_22690 [Candidatus Binatia bacterium]
MPRKTGPQSFLDTLKRQAAKAVVSLQQEITRRAKELTALKEEAERWVNIIGRQSPTAKTTAARRRTRQKSARIDWNAVLAELPATFTARDVAQKTGKPMEQVYAGVSRWAKDKKIKKGKNGYRKAAAAGSRRAQEEGKPPAQKQAVPA